MDGFKERYDLSNLSFRGLPGGASLGLRLSIPRLNATDATFEADIHHTQRDLRKWSSYVEQRTGLSVGEVW